MSLEAERHNPLSLKAKVMPNFRRRKCRETNFNLFFLIVFSYRLDLFYWSRFTIYAILTEFSFKKRYWQVITTVSEMGVLSADTY